MTRVDPWDRPVAEGADARVLTLPDPAAVSLEAARRIAEALAAADSERGRADWATTGGSSVVGIYRALTETSLMELMPWGRLHMWWGDDRYVPRDHPLSNVKPFDDIVAGIALGEEGTAGGGWPGEPLPFDQIHPFRAGEAIASGRGPAWGASAMSDELKAAGLATSDGWPVFDVLLIGVGPDGHLLSVFPGSPAIGSTELAMAIPAPTHIEPHLPRLTLNPAVIGAARQVLVVATGAAKAQVLGEIFGPTRDPKRWPAQLALGDNATWILDAAAAASLPPRP
jgi:6-phosphogluconolactonase